MNKKTLLQQFNEMAQLVSPLERNRNINMRRKELWLRQLLEGMDQVLNSKPVKVTHAK